MLPVQCFSLSNVDALPPTSTAFPARFDVAEAYTRKWLLRVFEHHGPRAQYLSSGRRATTPCRDVRISSGDAINLFDATSSAYIRLYLTFRPIQSCNGSLMRGTPRGDAKSCMSSPAHIAQRAAQFPNVQSARVPGGCSVVHAPTGNISNIQNQQLRRRDPSLTRIDSNSLAAGGLGDTSSAARCRPRPGGRLKAQIGCTGS